ncbi:MAG: sigma-70 family RNA polymerase sigma factor [Myxococcales bacterium]|nr:sigma-70 family RNA polymerase sigma factor [Myxococcales bacterium]
MKGATTTTADLVRASLAGDGRAFSSLVEGHQDAAFGYALSQLGSAAAAQDAVQDAFVDAYLKLASLREPQAFAGWLRRILFKHCDRQRRRRKPTSSDVGGLSTASDPSDRLEARQTRRELLAAVDALPEPLRVVTALHYLAGLPLGDVATFVDLPLTTIKKRLFTARKRLREEDLMATTPMTPTPFAHRIELFVAIRAGDQATIERIVSEDPSLLEAEESWSDEEALAGGLTLAHHLTPLILAAGYGDLDTVELLLSLGASPEGRCGCHNGETAIWAAARAGHADVVDRLVAAGADPTHESRGGRTAGDIAAWRGNQELAERLPRSRAVAPPSASAFGLDGERLVTGIKAIDLWLPLTEGSVVLVHGPAETGLTVLLTELCAWIGRAGGRAVWSSWEPMRWHRREMETLVARAGVDQVVEVLVDHDDDDDAPLLDRAATKLRACREAGRLALHVVFEREGHRTEVAAALPQLRTSASLTVVVRPWEAVTRGDEKPPEALGAFDATLCLSPDLARRGLYPAIDPRHSRSRHDEDATEARRRVIAHLDDDTDDDVARRLLAFLTQPFVTAEPETSWPGVSVPRAATLEGVRAILEGRVALDEAALRYRGGLDTTANEPRHFQS